MPEKYIIDVDTGVDDAQAIMLALSCHNVDVIAITCVAGNIGVDQVCINTLKVLTVCGRTDIPVYKGADRALVGECLNAAHYHGMDGLGDNDLDIDVSETMIQKEQASLALLRLVNQFPGEVTLVALAPLTNIAMALRLDPDFGKKLKRITIMGGNTQGKGNITVCGEFNFVSDPEAALVVLNEMQIPITIVPWELNLTKAAGQPWDWFDKWIETDTMKSRFNKSILKVAMHRQRVVRKLPIFRSCDLNAMVTVIDPAIVKDTTDVYVTVELNGKYTRGMMVVDWNGILGKTANVMLVNEIDTERARKWFDAMIQ